MTASLSAHLFRLGSLILQWWTDCPGNTRKPLMYMRIETEVRKQKVLWKHVQPRLSIISERRSLLLSKRLLSRTGCSTASGILRVGCWVQHSNPVLPLVILAQQGTYNILELEVHWSAGLYQMCATKDKEQLVHFIGLSRGCDSISPLPLENKAKILSFLWPSKKVELDPCFVLPKLALPPPLGNRIL